MDCRRTVVNGKGIPRGEAGRAEILPLAWYLLRIHAERQFVLGKLGAAQIQSRLATNLTETTLSIAIHNHHNLS